jgi:hypothetical protein
MGGPDRSGRGPEPRRSPDAAGALRSPARFTGGVGDPPTTEEGPHAHRHDIGADRIERPARRAELECDPIRDGVDASRYMTGAVLAIDGGHTLR